LTKVDANGFYSLKGDVNVWINQIAVPYTGADRDVNLGSHGISYYDVNWTGGRVTNVPLDANIQSFIDNATSGDTLLLGSGTYTITSPIRVDKTLNIRGQGNAKIYNTTTDMNIFYVTADNTKISDLNIFDVGSGTKAIFVNGANNVTLRNLTLNTTGAGFEYGVYSLNGSGNILNSFFTINSTDQNAYTVNFLNNSSATQDQNWLVENTIIYANGVVRAKGVIVNNQNSSKYITANIVNSQIIANSTSNFSTYGLETTSTTTANARAYVYGTTIGGELTDVNAVRLNTIYLYATTLLNGTVGGEVHYLGTATANTIYFDINGAQGTYQEGKMFYDPTWKTLSVQIGRDVTMQVGQEDLTRVFNNTANTIHNGEAVYASGVYTTGDNNVMSVALARADVYNTSVVWGVATQDIPVNNYGFVTVRGYINDVNTIEWNVGDTLYLSDTNAGQFRTTQPDTPNYSVQVGTVITKSDTVGRVNIRIIANQRLGDLSDVRITNPTLTQVLTYNGIAWVNGSASTVSGSNGIAFYPDGNDINKKTNQNFFGIESLYKYPVTTTPQNAEAQVATAGLSPVEPYVYDTDLNRAIIDAGTWTFNMYLGANRIDRNPYLFNVIYKIRKYEPTDINVTTVGTGATRYVIASSGAPFSTALIDTNFTANDQNLYAGYLQTPKGAYKVVGRTSDTNITINTPTTYVNETDVKFFTWKRLFMARSQIITNVSPAYTLYSISSSQGSFDMNYTDRIGMMIVTVASNTTTITYVYNGSTYYSYFNTPLITLHNNLAGLQGGSIDEYYHLTQSQYVTAITVASSTQNGYLTSGDWTTFYNKVNSADVNIWTNQLLSPYLTKVDANGFYALKGDVNSWGDQRYTAKADTNIWINQKLVPYLLSVDANGFYTLKGDTNIWINQKLIPYLLQADANGFYTLKADTNIWIDQKLLPYLKGADANGFYAYKSDVNTWGDQRYMPLNTVLTTDTNWYTSWAVFDANMKSIYTVKADTNLWITQKLTPYLLQADGNGFYALKSDVNTWGDQRYTAKADTNIWITQKLSPYLLAVDANGLYAYKVDVNLWGDQRYYSITNPLGFITTSALDGYLSKTDANGFYPLKADVNVWANERIRLAQIDSNKWTLTKVDANAFYPLKADVNVWTNQLLSPYLTKVDANGFYPLKGDVNAWGDQRYLKLTGGNITGSIVATQDINAKVLKADNNIYVGSSGYMYDDGTAIIIGRR